jgi:hypothetical protein
VIGQAWKYGRAVPKTLVIVDPTGVVREVARSSTISPLIARTFYLNRLPSNIGFLGYIRDYNARLDYAVRSADADALSVEKIPVTTVAK